MPRGKHRGRRSRSNAKKTQRSRSSVKKKTNALSRETSSQRNPSKINSQCSKPMSEVDKTSGFNNNGHTGINKATASQNEIKLDTNSKRPEDLREISTSESRSCFCKLCKCLVNASEEITNITGGSNPRPSQEPESGMHNSQCSVRNKDFPQFSLVEKKKTPYGKVKIYSTGNLEITESERITREAVELLKDVKNSTKQEKQLKKSKSEAGSFVTRIRNFFGKQTCQKSFYVYENSDE